MVSSAGAFVRRHAYALFAAVVVVTMAGHTANQIWSSPDYWVHLAAVREFSNSLVDPGNPLTVGDATDPYLSPYAFALGSIVRFTGADAVSVLAVAGLANLALLLFAFRRFVAGISPVAGTPLLALVFTLTAWGLNPWRWSGFFELNSLGTVLPLSSTFASAVGLLTIAALYTWLRGGSRWHLAIAGVGAPLVLLCHPMTSVWVGLVGLAFVISESNADNVRRVGALVVVVGGATLVAAAWPYYSIVRSLGQSRAFNNAAMYVDVATRTFLALPGFVVLVLRFVRRHRDPLFLGAAFNVIVYAAGYVFDLDSFGRVLPGIMLMAHVALAIWVAELISRRVTIPRGTKYGICFGITAIVIVGVIGSATGLIRAVPRGLMPTQYADDARLEDVVAPYEQLGELIARDDVVVASPDIALRVAAVSGKVIAPPAPAPFVDHIARRRAVDAALRSPETSSSELRSLLDEHRVQWFVVTPFAARGLTGRVRDGTLRRVVGTEDLVVFRVVDAATP